MEFELRPWQPEDEALTRRLVTEQMGPVTTAAWGQEYGLAALEEMIRFIREDEGETYVVEVAGQEVGLLGYTIADETMHISTLIVDSSVQGQGLGDKLLQTCIDRAELRSVMQLEAWVQTTNSRALHLLERAGFMKQLGEVALETVEFIRPVSG